MTGKSFKELGFKVGDKIQALPCSLYTFDSYPEGDIGYVTEVMDGGRLTADFSGKHPKEGLYFRDGGYKILEEKKQPKGNGVAMIYWADTNEFVKEVPVQIDVKVTFLEE